MNHKNFDWGYFLKHIADHRSTGSTSEPAYHNRQYGGYDHACFDR